MIAAAAALGVDRLELISLLLAIAFVLVAEMVNSAIEGAIDVSTTSFDPNAKLAKDIAAGAVLISTVTALAVGYLIFAHAAAHRTAHFLDRVRDAPAEITLVALVLVLLIVIATKAWTGSGTPLRGGLPSGHAAIAFAGWMAATYVDQRPASFPDLVAHVHHGAARRPDARGVGRALGAGSALRRRARRARHPRRVPAAVMTGEELVTRAEAAAANAYAPYSNYLVGATVLLKDGRIFDGVNVENAAYPLGICAEKTAISKAASEGVRPGDIDAIGITASPCGGCRQWLHEWRIERVYFRREDGSIAEYAPAAKLLPDAWDLP